MHMSIEVVLLYLGKEMGHLAGMVADQRDQKMAGQVCVNKREKKDEYQNIIILYTRKKHNQKERTAKNKNWIFYVYLPL